MDEILRRCPVRKSTNYIVCNSDLSMLRPWARGYLDYAVLRQREPINTTERTETAMSIAGEVLDGHGAIPFPILQSRIGSAKA
eukprot:6817020-Prorocentrum_lima.AAC.1